MRVTVGTLGDFEDLIKAFGGPKIKYAITSFTYKMGLMSGIEFCVITNDYIAVCYKKNVPINWADEDKMEEIRKAKDSIEKLGYIIIGGAVDEEA